MPLNEALREYNAKRSEGKEKAGVSKKERDASRIQIECVDTPDGKNDGYIVCVTPKPKKGKEGKGEPFFGDRDIKRVFETKAATLAYLEKAL